MKNFNEYYIGQTACLSKKFTADNVKEFANLTGDFNPLHIDEDYSNNTHFGRCIVHGTFYTAIIGTVLGTSLPGLGTILVSQEHKFIKPVFIEDTVTATLEIAAINPERKLITLNIVCTNQQGEEVLKGIAIVKKLY